VLAFRLCDFRTIEPSDYPHNHCDTWH